MTGHDGLSETLLGLLLRRDGHPALVEPRSRTVWSHARLHAEVQAVAGQLSGLGIGPEDRVALSLANSPMLVAAFLAIGLLGAAVAPLNPALTEPEMVTELDDLQIGLVLHSAPASRALVAAAESLGVTCRELRLGADGEVVVEGSRASEASAAGDGSSIALLLHTSGTTSRPKTVPLRQRNLVAGVRNVMSTYQLSADDVSYCVMPLFHIHGLMAATFAALAAGGTVVVPPGFSGTTFWEDIHQAKATWYTAVPTIHHVVLAVCEDGRQKGHGLRFVRSCSSTLPAPLWRRFEDTVGVPLVEAYGMTEAAHQMASNPLPPAERRPGSVGIAAGIEIAVLDDDWRPVPTGERGEVCISGPSVVDGYLDNPDADAAAFREDWFRTGDVGTLSHDGYLTLVGRIKELINRGGEKISPYEIESVLLEHPAVSEAAAYPVPDDKYGEVVAAVVVASGEVTVAQLTAHCAARIVGFKVPSAITLRPEIPKGPTGKVQRRLLASLVTL